MPVAWHIIGTERHESRRVDNQLRGRSGRQGDPGSSRFYVSFEDNLIRIFASDRVQGMMQRTGMGEDEVIPAQDVYPTDRECPAQGRIDEFRCAQAPARV